ncbi:alpha/beta fold hydrolase [Amnibacterium setariae]|uniref:Alpha/beta fold hydrolase n=1 Tax=Amnibacterium setariae TaxID=2306585 RepID=A0A3A1TVC9_9MICO|nr:alpha/beta fold hydrolase [Amnibacterium setariae]RIX27749.1 alpha/beta fold hydrolase [Amnibacterium setariae]
MRRGRRGLVAVLLTAALALGPAVAAGAATTEPSGAPTTRAFSVPVAEAPGSSSRIRLDATLYTPAATPAPAVLLAHGFGQTKADLAPAAERLRREGYVVLAYTARGFGRSGGRIGLDSLDGEVPDARAMVDVLARDPAVERRGGDPVVGVVGGSYGGALALMLGATDPRIDTVVAAITWNDLADALAPPSVGRVPGGAGEPLRDFKVGWASRLFGAGIAGSTDACGRFTPAFCDLYRRLVTGGTATPADLALLERSSPEAVLAGMRAPTLLLQGEQDRLFGLDQADANARQLRAAGAPVQVRWFDGGHDGGGIAGTDGVIDDWLRDRLRTRAPVSTLFSWAVPASATAFREKRVAPAYPGLAGTGTTRIPLEGGVRTVVNPPGGQPQSVTGIPGLSASTSVGRTAGSLLAAANPPSEAAAFASAPLTAPAVLTGSARVRLRVTPSAAGTAVLYAQLSARTGDEELPLPGGVAPIRVALPEGGGDVDVTLPATSWSLAPGDRLVLTVRTSDSQLLGSTAPASDRIAVASPIALPTVAVATRVRSAGLPTPGVLLGIAAALLVAVVLLVLGAVLGRRRQRPAPPVPPVPPEAEAEGPPLEIAGLVKRFRGGFLAVDDVGFTAQRGQVVGLLGENGAGKTTTLRMVAGLLRPDAGTVRAFGAPLGPGSPALERIGCFIEGPGFLPHLSGRRNLELYWAATGRPRRDARFDEALAVADLGGAIRKPVRGYSQGMRQRLAIAQAMLGLPDLLILDEPTNGLDPPQITALRGVLQRYAAAGRTVVVSSHLLGEVERTCSHVVVMSHGRVVAAGPVEAIAGEATELVLTVTDVPAAVAAVRVAGVEAADPSGTDAVRVRPGAVPVQDVVAAVVAAGVGVTGVTRGRHLEEAFLDLIGATEPSA